MDKTTICNMALGHIRAATITVIDEHSPEAAYCRTYYDTARQATLAAHNWSFARRRASLALLQEAAPPFWNFRYAYPSDAVKIRELENVLRNPTDPYPWEIELDALGQNKTIVCDVPNAVAVYTADLQNPNLFIPEFNDMLSWRLASYLAVPCAGRPEDEKRCFQWWQYLKDQAEPSDANEGQEEQEPDGKFVQSRL